MNNFKNKVFLTLAMIWVSLSASSQSYIMIVDEGETTVHDVKTVQMDLDTYSYYYFIEEQHKKLEALVDSCVVQNRKFRINLFKNRTVTDSLLIKQQQLTRELNLSREELANRAAAAKVENKRLVNELKNKNKWITRLAIGNGVGWGALIFIILL